MGVRQLTDVKKKKTQTNDKNFVKQNDVKKKN